MVRQLSNVSAAVTVVVSLLANPALAANTATSVSITENGARSHEVSGNETSALCSKFKLTERDVRQFFARSVRVTSRDYNHDLSMSNCYAAGRISFANGTRGRWWIDLERRGLLILSNGQWSYRYCRSCTSPPYDEPYDPAKDG